MDVRTLKSLEWDRVLALLSLCAETVEGKARVRTLEPERIADMVRARHARVEECVRGEALCGRLSLRGYGRVESRVPEGIAFPLEVLRKLLSSLRRWSAAIAWLKDESAPKPALIAGLQDVSSVENISRLLGTVLNDRGEIADTASERLRRIRRERERARESVLKRMESLSKSLGDNILRDNNFTVRGGRLVLPVRSSFKSEVRGILHDTSSSGGTFFIEPVEAVELNNRITALDAEERDEIKRIVIEVSAKITSASEELDAAFDFIEALDVDLACARFGAMCRGTLPVINDRGEFHLKGARHPLLDPSLHALRKEIWGETTKGPVVPLDLSLSLTETKTLIVSGPNAGGKSVALKTAGLIALMHQAGIPCPVEEGTTLPVFPHIHATMGDSQSILDDLSTFSARMVVLKEALGDLREPFLFILDELGSGTDPAEGAALARAILERLHDASGITLCSTHYEALKALALVTPNMENASMAFEEEKMAPTFRLKPGSIGSSRAIEIAKRSGLPADLLASARSYLPEGEKHLKDVLEALEREIADYAQLREDMENRTASLDAARRELEENRAAQMDEKRKFLESLPERLRKMKDEFIGELREEAGRRATRKAATRIAPKMVEKAAKELDLPEVSAAEKRRMPLPGEWVSVLGMGIRGEVTGGDEGTGLVTLDCGGKTLSIGVGDVLVCDPPDGVSARRGGVETGPVNAGPEIKLIGMRVDEAEMELEPFVDRALLAGLSRLRVIHGVGTGRLRRAVREWAKGSNVVSGVMDAAPSEGGAGATILILGEPNDNN